MRSLEEARGHASRPAQGAPQAQEKRMDPEATDAHVMLVPGGNTMPSQRQYPTELGA